MSRGRHQGQEFVDDHVTGDRLLGGWVQLRQPASGYRAAIDPVFLAAAITAQPGSRILDLGCGVGAAGLCLLARQSGLHLVGLELQQDLAQLARENAAANGLEDAISIVAGDLRRCPLVPGGFDQVMVNPAFHPATHTRPPRDVLRALALHEGETPLETWCAVALAALKPGGCLTMILRADRLDEITQYLRHPAVGERFGGLDLFPLWPKVGRPAKRIIIRARKGAKNPGVLYPGLLLHEPDGTFTGGAGAVLEEAAALSWG